MVVKTNGLLLRAHTPSVDRCLLEIDPASQGLRYLAFAVYEITAGDHIWRGGDSMERLAVVLEGRAALRAGTSDFGEVRSRSNVFERTVPPVLLVAPGEPLLIEGRSNSLIAVAEAPGGAVHRTALIGSEQIVVEERGGGKAARRVHHLLPAHVVAGRLLAFEVFTPGGNWSSYPPHKHDREDPPREARLEEIYFYRFARPEGFALHRVYTQDGTLDETVVPRDRDAVIVRSGYHMVGVPVGYDCYYLNVMAGPRRAWQFQVDPDHAWLMDWDPNAPRQGEPSNDRSDEAQSP